MIPVTKPYLPKAEKYIKIINEIYEREWLTNNGPVLIQLETELKKYLELDHLLVTSNGTIALQLAFRALGLSGSVLTTPFSYVATTSTLVWENLKPVFVDIDPLTCNLNPALIEASIQEDTTAILATHCFGNPCDIDKIQSIADKHKLKVIYDAAHCFGTLYKGKSVFEYGDISTTSFHATKLFHTIEGGAVISRSEELINKISLLRNFGHNGPEKFKGVGINGKNSEMHAAMGLCVLEDIDEILMMRKNQSLFYDSLLQDLNAVKPIINGNSEFNYAYYPIIFKTEHLCLKSKKALEQSEIFPRRYFYPSLSELDYITEKFNVSHSDSISKRILCLPLYHQLSEKQQKMISEILIRQQKDGKF